MNPISKKLGLKPGMRALGGRCAFRLFEIARAPCLKASSSPRRWAERTNSFSSSRREGQTLKNQQRNY